MRPVFRSLVVPLLACEAILILAIVAMYLLGHNPPFDPEARQYMHLALVIGVVIVLACWPICRLLRRVAGTLVGLAIGFVTAPVAGWIWGRLTEYLEYYSFGVWARDWSLVGPWAWIEGLTLLVPGGIAGAVVGFLQAKGQSRSRTARATR